MPEDAPRPAQAAIRTALGAIFVSLELSCSSGRCSPLARLSCEVDGWQSFAEKPSDQIIDLDA
jgi:hypothetical protein